MKRLCAAHVASSWLRRSSRRRRQQHHSQLGQQPQRESFERPRLWALPRRTWSSRSAGQGPRSASVTHRWSLRW
ncbi:MAG TPA: hypothetical protein DCQ06_02895 [Myxococcales bacterium]|nr:hypothetical protein [Myxococcales bacterium]